MHVLRAAPSSAHGTVHASRAASSLARGSVRASAHSSDGASTLLTDLAHLRQCVFHVVYHLTHTQRGDRVVGWSPLITTALFFLRILQLASFPLSRELDLAWHKNWTLWLQWLAGLARVDPLLVGDSINDTVSFAVLLPTIAVVLAWFVLLFYTWRTFISPSAPSTLAEATAYLDASRIASTIMTSVLYIPILSILLRTNRCSSDASTTCWDAGHATLAVLGDLTAAVFVPLSYCTHTLMPSRKPVTVNPATNQYEVEPHAVAHTRLHHVEFIATTVLVLVVSLLSSSDASDRWLATIATVGCLVVIAGACLYYLPFYHFRSNIMHTAAFSVLGWAAVCMVIVQVYDDPSQRVASVMLYGCAPLVALVAAFICLARRYIIQHTAVADFQSIYALEMSVRFMLRDKLDAWNAEHVLGMDDTTLSLLRADTSARQAIDRGEEMFSDVAQHYQAGARRFHHSALLQVLMAQFHRYYMCNPHVAARMLARAEEREPSLNVEFCIFEQRRETEDVLTSNSETAVVMDYIRYMQRFDDASEMHVAALRGVYEFWTEMLQDEPDMTRLDMLGAEVHAAVTEAYRAYQDVIHINRDSGKVTAAYAQFVGKLLNDNEQGSNLEKRAEELIRMSHQRKREEDDPTSRIFDDATGVIAISGEPDTPGVILSANDAVCDLLGRLRGDLIGNNISTIMSNPFSSLHDSFITRYQSTGTGMIIDQTRALYALHKNGFLLPITLTVKQVSGGLSKSVFIGIITEAKLSDREHAALVNTTTGQIMRTTPGAARLLGLSLSDIVAGLDTEISRYLPGFSLDVSADQVATSTLEAARQVDKRALLERRARRRERIRKARKHKQRKHTKDGQRRLKKKKAPTTPMTLTVDYHEVRAMQETESSSSSSDSSAWSSDEEVPEHKENAPVQALSPYRSPEGHQVSIERDSVEHVVQVWVQRLDFVTVSVDVVRMREKAHVALDDAHDSDASSMHNDFDTPLGQRPADADQQQALNLRANEDARSQMSRGSGVSGRSGMSSTELHGSVSYIRSLFVARSHTMAQSMRLFRVAFFATVLILLVVGVIGAIITAQSFDNFETHVNEIVASGSCRSHTLQMLQDVKHLNLLKAGHLQPATLERAQDTQASLQTKAFELREAMSMLYLRKSGLTDEHLQLYSYPGIVLDTLEDQNEAMLSLGLMQTATLLITHALFVAENTDPLNALTMGNEHMFFVQANALEHIVEPFNRSTNLYQASARATADNVEQVEIALLCVSLGVMSIMLVGVFMPTIRKVERTRERVYDIFRGISVNHIKRLQEETRAELAVMDGLDALDVDDSPEDASNSHDELEVAQVVGAYGKRKRGKKKKKKNREYRNKGNRSNQLLRKVSFLFLLACAYFATVFVVESELIAVSLSRLPELNWAGRRRFFTQAAFVTTRDVVEYPHSSTDPTNRRKRTLPQLLEAAQEAIGTARLVNQALLFSNEALDLHEQSIQRYEERDELMYGDACGVLSRHGAADRSACEAFNNGVLTVGLDNALEDFLRRCQNLIVHVETTGATEYNETSMRADLNSDEFTLLAEYQVWLQIATDHAAKQYEDEEAAKLDDFVKLHTTMLVVFLILCVLLFLFVYDPMIKRLDSSLKKTRGMLLMIPFYVMNATPSIKKALAAESW